MIYLLVLNDFGVCARLDLCRQTFNSKMMVGILTSQISQAQNLSI